MEGGREGRNEVAATAAAAAASAGIRKSPTLRPSPHLLLALAAAGAEPTTGVQRYPLTSSQQRPSRLDRLFKFLAKLVLATVWPMQIFQFGQSMVVRNSDLSISI